MKRRVFLAAGIALAADVRRAWAQIVNSPAPARYAALTTPVKIPIEAVAERWHPVPFVAEGVSQSRRILISGILFRTDTDLTALCVTCPHEQCQVDLVTDTDRLRRMVGENRTQPLFECGCHLSIFDAANAGARISGESPRGLFRFRIAGVRDGTVEIAEIEEVALSEV